MRCPLIHGLDGMMMNIINSNSFENVLQNKMDVILSKLIWKSKSKMFLSRHSLQHSLLREWHKIANESRGPYSPSGDDWPFSLWSKTSRSDWLNLDLSVKPRIEGPTKVGTMTVMGWRSEVTSVHPSEYLDVGYHASWPVVWSDDDKVAAAYVPPVSSQLLWQILSIINPQDT